MKYYFKNKKWRKKYLNSPVCDTSTGIASYHKKSQVISKNQSQVTKWELCPCLNTVNRSLYSFACHLPQKWRRTSSAQRHTSKLLEILSEWTAMTKNINFPSAKHVTQPLETWSLSLQTSHSGCRHKRCFVPGDTLSRLSLSVNLSGSTVKCYFARQSIGFYTGLCMPLCVCEMIVLEKYCVGVKWLVWRVREI